MAKPLNRRQTHLQYIFGSVTVLKYSCNAFLSNMFFTPKEFFFLHSLHNLGAIKQPAMLSVSKQRGQPESPKTLKTDKSPISRKQFSRKRPSYSKLNCKHNKDLAWP